MTNTPLNADSLSEATDQAVSDYLALLGSWSTLAVTNQKLQCVSAWTERHSDQSSSATDYF